MVDPQEYIELKRPKMTLFFGMFWRWGIIIIILANLILSPLLIPLANLSIELEKILISIGIGIAPFAMGMDYILAVIFKWPHIILVDQSAYHQKMSAYHLRWSDINAKEYIFIGCLFSALAIGILLIGICS